MTRNLRDNDNKSATELKSHLEEMKKANEKLVTGEELEKIKAEIEMMKTNSDKLFKAIAWDLKEKSEKSATDLKTIYYQLEEVKKENEKLRRNEELGKLKAEQDKTKITIALNRWHTKALNRKFTEKIEKNATELKTIRNDIEKLNVVKFKDVIPEDISPAEGVQTDGRSVFEFGPTKSSGALSTAPTFGAFVKKAQNDTLNQMKVEAAVSQDGARAVSTKVSGNSAFGAAPNQIDSLSHGDWATKSDPASFFGVCTPRSTPAHNGSTVKFQAVAGDALITKDGQLMQTLHQCITAMKVYED